MVSDEIVAAIDVGTTKVCTIVGRRAGKDGVQILGYSTAKNSGMRKGVVSDVSAAERAVRVSIKAVEDKTGHKVDSAFVGVTGAHVRFENRHERLEVENRKGIVTADDVASAPKKLSESVDVPGRTVIHANSISYTLDGEPGIRYPVGMHSKEMQVEAHLVTGANTFIDRLVDVIEMSGVKINSLVLEPLASGMAVLSPKERQKGAVIVDIGGGTTDIVAFKGSGIYYTGVIPVGWVPVHQRHRSIVQHDVRGGGGDQAGARQRRVPAGFGRRADPRSGHRAGQAAKGEPPGDMPAGARACYGARTDDQSKARFRTDGGCRGLGPRPHRRGFQYARFRRTRTEERGHRSASRGPGRALGRPCRIEGPGLRHGGRHSSLGIDGARLR